MSDELEKLRKLDAEYGRVEAAIIMADREFDGDSDHANCGDRLIASVQRLAERAEAAEKALAAQKTEPASPAISLLYTNYRNETADRLIKPMDIRYGQTEWHPHDQYLMLAWDMEKRALREFALMDFITPYIK